MQSLPSDRLAVVLLLCLIAGCVDAVGFTELGGYFVSFMSGNSTRLGLHLAYHEWHQALFAFGLVALFVGGAAAGALIVERAGWGASAVILLIEAALLAGAALLIDGPRPLLGAVLLPTTMGLSNAFLPGTGGMRPGLTYMTGTLVRIGARLAALGRNGEGRALALDLLLWFALVCGVVMGGVGRLRFGGQVLFGPVAVLAVLGIAESWFAWRRRA